MRAFTDESSTPDVTIGLPVFNGENYLPATIESLLSQDARNLSILISDNASTDGTPRILSEWQDRDPRVRVFRQKANIGAQRNFQWLASHAESPWFMFAAHDDKWSTNYVSALLSQAQSAPNCELALPRVIYSYEDSTPTTHCDIDENILTMGGNRRIRALLRAATGTWIYGLHETRSIQNAFSMISTYPYTWGFDMVLILPMILRSNVTATNDAVFTNLQTAVSRTQRRPKSSSEQLALGSAFRRTAFDILRREIPNPIERWQLLYPVLAYADRHGFKMRRALKNSLKEFLSKPDVIDARDA